jgi:uncharacterized repeat protein (TIGR03803 family)
MITMPTYEQNCRLEHSKSLKPTTCWTRVFVILVFACTGPMIAPAQTFTSLLSFNGQDGAFPQNTLVRGANGNFYGTTPYGGAEGGGCGNVVELTAAGRSTTLFDFECTNGSQPYSGVIRGRNGNFYGVTAFGGSNGIGGTILRSLRRAS